ncbi:MAG TPA: hypothetical protein VHG11_04810 [Pseudorhizobium sp.]|nr:hypothetical protein [Pseudorhizobium sp.]
MLTARYGREANQPIFVPNQNNLCAFDSVATLKEFHHHDPPHLDETALPYRHLGSFISGDGVGGAGVHRNGQTWRPMQEEFILRSYIEQDFGIDIIPKDMTIEDRGVTYVELEPYFDRFEYVAGIAGQAVNGEIIKGGNPFEARRSRGYPRPPLPHTLDAEMFAQAAR